MRQHEKKEMGLNKTGIDMAPVNSKTMIEGALKLTRTPPGDELGIAMNRLRFAEESEEGVGSVPLPGTLKGAIQGGVQALAGNDPAMLIDKLGERLAFERAGVRLYEALISKHPGAVDVGIYPSLERLEEIRDEEFEHFMRVAEVIRHLGADPTAQTPSADVTATLTSGVLKVASDARTSFADTLEAVLTAELIDNDSWALLIALVDNAGLTQAGDSFREALAQEVEHLNDVREWVKRFTLGKPMSAARAA